MKALVPSPKFALSKATRIVPYLTPDEVYQVADAAGEGRKGERNELLILLLFETGLRISEALSLTPRDIQEYSGRPVLAVLGKGKKKRLISCPENLAHRIKSYAYTKHVGLDMRIFPIKRKRAWQIVKAASEKAGVSKRVFPHLFRHSDAIERLKQTGNPKSLQLHLGHSSMVMTMRYLSTLQEEDSLGIEQQVVFER